MIDAGTPEENRSEFFLFIKNDIRETTNTKVDCYDCHQYELKCSSSKK
jgi:hypothetical protein